MVGAVLEKTMKMKTRASIPEVIADIENKPIPNGGPDQGDWPLSIDAHRRPVERAIGVCNHPFDRKIENYSL